MNGRSHQGQIETFTFVKKFLADDTGVKEVLVATGKNLGVITLVPIIITVILAFVLNDVLLALIVGILTGYAIWGASFGTGSTISKIGEVFGLSFQTIFHVATDPFNLQIFGVCFTIGGMVELIHSNGGFAALADSLRRRIDSPKKAALTAQLMGSCLFFDDYANVLITGPTMQTITDSQGISREKLAYIVDSTAAPVAGMVVVSSWISAELVAIKTGLDLAGVHASAYNQFVGSLPYRTYNFMALFLIFITIILGREYGPMLYAERRARITCKRCKQEVLESHDEKIEKGCIWSALLPIITLIIYSVIGFYVDGMSQAIKAGVIDKNAGFSFSYIHLSFSYANTVKIIIQAALLGAVVALVMGCFTKKLKFRAGLKAWLKGAQSIFSTVFVLVLAWCLAKVVGLLGTAYYLVDLVSANVPYYLLPVVIFITCCVISFVVGSFGCMAIVMPIALPVVYSAVQSSGLGYAEQFVFASIAAVLSGAVFGDNCSPITDTTILSSVGAGCPNIDHVKTQLPYALTAAISAAIFGFLPAGFGISPFISLVGCTISCLLTLLFIGKKI
ncbi:malate-H+ Na+-lactate antiporter [Ligilactobacillus ceti DSM 22408]|uniref:Malate-H+ Na+-lactate antiporter n=1 Tax=Ligilactobacillus ceti DSM 22408 TaxID=1122146 RepID=A0A0R2KM54_9LACO|nr:malate-H+ Na+-lactate antiporter [Ligilactobacillus ceti DSM 22408]